MVKRTIKLGGRKRKHVKGTRKQNNCKSDIFQINYKVKIPGAKERVLVEPKMLDESISAVTTKSFYMSCLAKFKEKSLENQENASEKNSFFKAMKGTKHARVPSSIIKIMSNRVHFKNIMDWLIQNNVDEKELNQVYSRLNKLIKKYRKKKIDKLSSKIIDKLNVELNNLEDVLSELSYSVSELKEIDSVLNRLSDIISSNLEIPLLKSLKKDINEVKVQVDEFREGINVSNEDNYEHNVKVALELLFKKGNPFYFGGQKYYIKKIVKTSSANVKQMASVSTVYANLTLVETKEETMDYSKLDCSDKKRQLLSTINSIYGKSIGYLKETYNSSRYQATKIGKKVFDANLALKKRRRDDRKNYAIKKQREVLSKNFLKNLLNVNGGTRKARNKSRIKRKTRRRS